MPTLVAVHRPRENPPSRSRTVANAVVRTCLCGCGAKISPTASWAVGHASRGLWAKLRAAGYSNTAEFVTGRVTLDRRSRT